MFKDHEGRYSSKRILAFGCFFLVCLIVIKYLYSGKVDNELVITLLAAASSYLGISAFDRRTKNNNNEKRNDNPLH